MNIKQFISEFKGFPLDGLVELTGRVIGKREVGKIAFYDLMQDHGVVQVTKCGDHEPLIRGDFVQVRGYPVPTRDGSAGLRSHEITVLDKAAIEHFPDAKMGYTGNNRIFDLLSNPQSNQLFRTRAGVMKKLRAFLDSKDFLEVETPILSENANGANARPFQTSRDDSSRLYLRIAPELYLKRLIIGGFDSVYELGKVFRNEGVDSTHNPEFTSLEVYKSFSYFRKHLIPLVEELFMQFGIMFGKHVDAHKILCKHGFELSDDMHTLRLNMLKMLRYTEESLLPNHKLYDRLFDRFVLPECTEPSIVTGFPLFSSPLAAASSVNPLLADRLEVYLDGKEVGNGYQELTDPFEQQLRFTRQLMDRNTGDVESPLPDAGYIDDLKVGMPPTVGFGLGVDRLVMYLTKQSSIKSVVLFPALK